ncbi:MAG: antitoxin [Acidobacteria bacterium]|nr:MAG: antitoxin [Acidobacteriota bacterium]
MRTTIAIDDNLLRRAKERARRRGITLGRLVEEALRREIAAEAERGERPELPVFHGTGVRPGVDLSSNRAIEELLDDGVPPEKLR